MGVIWLASARGAQAIQSDAAAGVRSAPGPLLHIAAIAGHVIEFGILGALLNWALPVRRNWLRRGAAWALASAYGGVDEWHQSWVPGRYPSVEDVAVDSVSGLAGAFASDLLLDVAQAAVSAAADPIPPASERE
jgi:VanZ family protein